MKEIICLNVGQAGVQLGSSTWELLCAEHGIDEQGTLLQPLTPAECIDSFFSPTSYDKYVPRNLFVDLEPSVIDEIRMGANRNLFHPDRLISGPEDAASNFARGFFTVGKLILGVVNHELRKLLENADNASAIFIFRSLGGGTGSGLTSAVFDSLIDYSKLTKVEIPIYPSPTLSSSMVEPYNCLLSEHFCIEDIDVGLLMDNEALYDICSHYIGVKQPTFTSINRLISQVTSSLTASIRFESVLHCDLTVLQTNLVPYPRIHFPMANIAPVLSAVKAVHEEVSVLDLTRSVFERDNQMMKIDHSFGKFMSCSLLYRGDVSPHHVHHALAEIKRDRNINFVSWCPTGFKVGINVCPPTAIPFSEIYPTSKNLTMLANTTAIGQAWQRLTHKFYLLYSKRSFVHWFVGEGMEECEFTESLYNISALVKDYEEVALDEEVIKPEIEEPININHADYLNNDNFTKEVDPSSESSEQKNKSITESETRTKGSNQNSNNFTIDKSANQTETITKVNEQVIESNNNNAEPNIQISGRNDTIPQVNERSYISNHSFKFSI